MSTPMPSSKEAASAFENLRQVLSHESTLHRVKTGQVDRDPEKNAFDESFDLEAYLRNNEEERRRYGGKRKAIAVVWDDLEVKGVGGMRILTKTFFDGVTNFTLAPYNQVKGILGIGPKRSPKTILHPSSGFVRPGESVLVLGRPGSSCSTFLRAITNQRGTFVAVNGTVTYGGISATEMEKRYRGEVVYNTEDDAHFPTLSVAQTIMFALRTKTPGNLLPTQSRHDFKQSVLGLLLRILGIQHTASTNVGNAFIRGVSGGERKRVSLAESMATNATVSSFDNASRGLDASSALDFAKSIRTMTDLYQSINFVSLYQAGEQVVQLFDRVIVLDAGRIIYNGPTRQARAYFEDLGFIANERATTGDFLTGCTDPNERETVEARSNGLPVPLTPEDLEAAWRDSSIYKDMLEQRTLFLAEGEEARKTEFRDAVRESKRTGVSSKSPLTANFWTTVKALSIRQFQLRLQDRVGLFVSFMTAIAVSTIAGSVYLNLPVSSSGAFQRGGVLFISILFNSFQAFAELPSQMTARSITSKQTGYAFYRPAALTIAQTLSDAPINMLKILIFCSIIYNLAGLSRTAGAFFTYYIIVLSGYFSLAAFFRLLGTICSSYDIAGRLAAVFITTLVLYSGYLVPVFSMQRFLFWIYYINPLAYCFSSAMVNEFSRLDLVCDGTFIVPGNVGNLTKYPTILGANQVCTLPGAIPGAPNVSGSAYILANFAYGDTLWLHFGITLVFFLFFLALQMIAAELSSAAAQAPEINVFCKEDDELKALNDKLKADRLSAERGELQRGDALSRSAAAVRQPLIFENLSYSIPVGGADKILLNDVFGYVKPGTLTALMGASGAGKTTLLDVLAARKSTGTISGLSEIVGRGGKSSRSFARGTAYAEQSDVHDPTSTVRAALRFSAYLRQSASISKEEKDAYVEEVLVLLELDELADALIGFPGFGLSIEARKRVTIGVELASKPELLLFLDEPTTGLDSQSAWNLVRFLKKLAAFGLPVLCTIHQPNATLFESFDRLMLLGQGRCVYFGEIGDDSHVIRSYFTERGAVCPPDANMAEYMLEATGAGSRKSRLDWADLWSESEELVQVKEEIVRLKGIVMETDESDFEAEYAAPFLTQLKLVIVRASNGLFRNPNYGLTRLFNHVVVSLFVGLTFLSLNTSAASLQYRIFAIFFVSFLPALIISQVEPSFIGARNIFYREASSKTYSPTVFAIAQLVAEIPYSILCSVVFFLLFYLPMNFNNSPDRAGFAFLVILTVEFFATTLGQMIASLTPSVYIASMVNPFILVLFSLFCGVTIPPPSMLAFWRVWLYPLDPLTRVIASLVVNELHDLPINCLPSELVSFTPPSGMTCTQWAGDFVAQAGGYLVDGAATTSCDYCKFSLGQQFYEPLGLSYSSRYSDWGILVAFVISNSAITVAATRWLNYSKR